MSEFEEKRRKHELLMKEVEKQKIFVERLKVLADQETSLLIKMSEQAEKLKP